jgi:hypothetical protein
LRSAFPLVIALVIAIPSAAAHHEKAAFAADALAIDLPDIQIPERDHVILLHGYDGWMEAKAPKSDWDYIRQLFGELGWSSGGKWVAYYGSDNGDVDLHDHGQHGQVDGGSAAHGGYATEGRNTHDRYTSIKHLGYHFAWAVYNEWNRDGICPSVLAHSMGGLIARAALTLYEAGDEAAPPDLCIRTVVTMGTPHAGHMFTGQCITTQCQQMKPRSAFLEWLATNMHPDGDGMTHWAAMGSQVDGLVAPSSTVAIDADAAVIYTTPADVHHSSFFGTPTYFTKRTTNDDAPALVWAESNFVETQTYWPARWADLALQLGAWSCGTRESPAPVEAGRWTMGNYEACRYFVAVPEGTAQLGLMLANTPRVNASFLVKGPDGTIMPECPHRGEKTIVCVIDQPAVGQWTVAVLESRSRRNDADWQSFAFAYVARPNAVPVVRSASCWQDVLNRNLMICDADVEDDGSRVTTTAWLTGSGVGWTAPREKTGAPGTQRFFFSDVPAGSYSVRFTAIDGDDASLKSEASASVVMKPKAEPSNPDRPPTATVSPPSNGRGGLEPGSPRGTPFWTPVEATAPDGAETERGPVQWVKEHPLKAVLMAVGILLVISWMRK